MCALLSDLKILEDGDLSEIGERGVCISCCSQDMSLTYECRSICLVGKKREVRRIRLLTSVELSLTNLIVSLARAVYSRASILFLDDVLSAGSYCFASLSISLLI